MRGRADMPRPVKEIVTDGEQTLARIRDDAQRLRDLGAEAKAGVEVAVKKAEATAAQILEGIGQMFETGAKSVCEKLDQIERGAFPKKPVDHEPAPTIKNGNPRP